ncbi:DUF4392 domain-containing protein, partial [Candidatus Bipolaricaulota bacterium]|nr:DUF4392 domain-containing protein [Candidatus Bipolaricaulota bacterium]
VTSGDVVFIATGWPNRPRLSPEIAESDGPAGAVVLGRALQKAANVLPVYVIEENLVNAMATVAQAGGFKVLSPNEILPARAKNISIEPAALIVGFPSDPKEAENVAPNLFEQYKPAALISIEKGGYNQDGLILTSWANDSTKYMAKVDFLIQEMKQHGKLLIGIGDGGNEIGMSAIANGVRDFLRFGDRIVPICKTDALVVASVSNWGAYGVAACLAFLKQDIGVFHDENLERRILHACVDAGLIDGITGRVEEGTDGLGINVHASIVKLLRTALLMGIKREKGEFL